jgi:hypothetical protein
MLFQSPTLNISQIPKLYTYLQMRYRKPIVLVVLILLQEHTVFDVGLFFLLNPH